MVMFVSAQKLLGYKGQKFSKENVNSAGGEKNGAKIFLLSEKKVWCANNQKRIIIRT